MGRYRLLYCLWSLADHRKGKGGFVEEWKVVEELSFGAGLPLYGIGYGVAIWVLSWGLGKLREVLACWVETFNEWMGR